MLHLLGDLLRRDRLQDIAAGMEVKGPGGEFGKASGKDQIDFGVSFNQILSYGQAAYGSEFDIQKGYVTDVFGGKGKKLFCAPEAVKFSLGNSFFYGVGQVFKSHSFIIQCYDQHKGPPEQGKRQ